MVWGHVSTSDSLLRQKVNRPRVFQFCLKTDKGEMVSGARDIIAEVTWMWNKRWSVRWHRYDIVEVEPNYPTLNVIFVLAHRGIVVFSFSINRTPRVGGEASIQPSLSHPLCFRFLFLLMCGCASCLRGERRRVRDLPKLLKSRTMFGWFSHIVNPWFVSIHTWVWIESPLSMCWNIFHFLDFWMYFCPDICSCDLNSLSSISSVGKVARMSPITSP
jgi:hypothetical protein